MSLPRFGATSALATALVAALILPASGAISPGNVLVLYNAASPDGAQVASYYAQVHPGVQLLGLTGLGLGEEISADTYLGTIRPQILPALTPSIDVLVTTKGLPLRIRNDHTRPSVYTDPDGVVRNVYASTWKPYSSLESELTQIDRISMWQQMGDQTWWSPQGLPQHPHHAQNPYYEVSGTFDHDIYGSRLTSRLDGFTVADITASVDRAQRAYLGPFQFVVDNDPNAPGASVNLMQELADNVLAPSGMPYTYDNTDEFITDAPWRVLGYVSYGTHGGGQPAPNDYLVDPVGGLTFNLANGAIFHTWESFNAYSFVQGGNHFGQALIAEWIARGGTAGIGHVEEPGANSTNITNEDWMFNMLLQGHTWAEAAWSATPQLSFVNTVVGDPLMVFKPLVMDGDYLDIIRSNWGQSVAPGDISRGDLNWDGQITGGDFDFLRAFWGSIPPPGTVPEPPGPVMLAALALVASAWLTRKR